MPLPFAALCALVLLAATPAQSTLVNHPLRLDDRGLILAWLPQERAYDGVVRRAWKFLQTGVPKHGPTGLPQYAVSCCLDAKNDAFAWPHNPAGLYAMLAESAIATFAYTGDRSAIELVRPLLDHQLAHGTTPKAWPWGGVPYASADHGSRLYRGAHDFLYDTKQPGRGDGYGVIEPDKVGELGLAYLRFWQATGKASYRDAALSCANALAKHVRMGDRAPWPFRVVAETNVVREETTASVTGSLRLLDELVRLGIGEVTSYRRARETAFRWLVDNALAQEMWANYFEDIPWRSDAKNAVNINPIEAARYFMEPGRDPEWRAHVPVALAYAERVFGTDAQNDAGTVKEKGVQWGAVTISEQHAYRFKMGSHTSRFASVLARWAELTGDAAARDKAFRSFNWASYMCQDDGRVITGPNEHSVWFTDGYGDYVRHYLAGMASVPAWAPPGEDHLLRSSSVVTAIDYRARRVSYKTYDGAAEDVLRLTFAPTKVTADGKPLRRADAPGADAYVVQPLTGGNVVVSIRRTRGRAIVIEGTSPS